MTSDTQSKMYHHYIPRDYLRGFAQSSKSPFVWVYERGRPYHPGHKRHHNPRRRPVSKAGGEEAHYSFQRRDGSVDADTYENQLEKLEKPVTPVLRKLRGNKMIAGPEKEVLASYLALMFKRVPTRKDRLEEYWPTIHADVSSELEAEISRLEADIDVSDTTRLEDIALLRDEVQQELALYEGEAPVEGEISRQAIVLPSPLGLPTILAAMTWQFLVAPAGHGFITSDDPVFFTGVRSGYGEGSLPIATDVAVVMCSYPMSEGFFTVSPEVVMEINQRTAMRARREVYFHAAERWVVDMLEEGRDGYCFLGPHLAVLSGGAWSAELEKRLLQLCV